MSEAKHRENHDRVLDIVLKEDDLSWKELILKLVREEGMDPWNIDVSRLAEKFLVMLNKLKKMDFRVSGKMVLAASLLLKIKSDRLLYDDLTAFDELMNGPEEELMDFMEDEGNDRFDLNSFLSDQKKIIPRTPQPRERQVSVFDLVNALEQALATDLRRQNMLARRRATEDAPPEVPRKTFDLSEVMARMQKELKGFFDRKDQKVFFHDLVKSPEKEDVIFTFIPLLHLENQQKVALNQEQHFGDIEVTIHHHKLNE